MTPAPASTPVVILQEEPEEQIDDPVLEWKFCVAALPVALAVAIVLYALGFKMLTRIVFGMPVHELGHAITAWFCGFLAIPTLWKTIVPEDRSIIATVLLFAALATLIYRTKDNRLRALGGALVVVQSFCTFAIRESTAEALVIFGGDGMGMVLATALMASFFFGRGTQLYKGSLRWGFLVIGAIAFVDMSGTWVASRNDFGNIPFGENEGSGASDPWKLVQEHLWTAETMVRRYLLLASACMLALAVVYAWGVRRAKVAIPA